MSSPKVTVRVARTAAPGAAPVSAATPDGRSTATIGYAPVLDGCDKLCDLVGQSWSATDAENPVDDQVAGQLGDRIIEVDHAAAGSDQCGEYRPGGVCRGIARRSPVRHDGPAERRRTMRRRRCCPHRP